MQPLDISTSFSSVRESRGDADPRGPPATSWASIFTSLMSLTITATRRPSRLASTWFRSVVLPAPRNPESTVTGRRASAGTAFMAYLRNSLSERQEATLCATPLQVGRPPGIAAGVGQTSSLAECGPVASGKHNPPRRVAQGGLVVGASSATIAAALSASGDPGQALPIP